MPMTFSTMNLHDVTEIVIGQPHQLETTKSWTRDIVVRLGEHRFTLTLFADTEGALGVQELLNPAVVITP